GLTRDPLALGSHLEEATHACAVYEAEEEIVTRGGVGRQLHFVVIAVVAAVVDEATVVKGLAAVERRLRALGACLVVARYWTAVEEAGLRRRLVRHGSVVGEELGQLLLDVDER